jgi:exopolyphosphatase/guanosine-5'-triphosphate,3'-diphosphate pyrophosphatase
MGPEGIEMTALALQEFAALSEGARGRGAVLTEAGRSSVNASEVLVAARAAGWPASTISAEEEAALVVDGLGPGGEGADLVIDLGGGSTEVIRARGEPVGLLASLKLGAVTLLETVGSPSDPPSSTDLENWRAAASEAARPLAALASGGPCGGGHRSPVVVLVGGSATTLGAAALGLAHYSPEAVEGAMLDPVRLRIALEGLARLTKSERASGPVGPDRAEIVVPGGILLLEILDRVGAEIVRLSARGLRHGLAKRLLRGDWPVSGCGVH